jgi:hypothetical protein
LFVLKKLSKMWNNELKSKLITLYRETPAFYDKRNQFYGDKNYADLSWIGITKKLGFIEGTG